MAPNSDFESQFFNPFSVNEELQNNELDPDVNSFSVFHLNIRSMKKHFEAFQDFIESLNFKFSAICLSKTWFQPHEVSDSNF